MSSIEKITESLEQLKISEMLELVKHLEEKWGVSASASVAAAPVASGQSAAAEKTTFDAILTSVGDAKINVIKEIRTILPTLGLPDAKALVESAPKPIKEGIKKEEAEEIKKKLEAVGAKVEIK